MTQQASAIHKWSDLWLRGIRFETFNRDLSTKDSAGQISPEKFKDSCHKQTKSKPVTNHWELHLPPPINLSNTILFIDLSECNLVSL